jgi:hypothetical protein
MLTELRQITSSEPYKSLGGMWIKQVTITPGEEQEATFTLELTEDQWTDGDMQVWEVGCIDLAVNEDKIPRVLIPGTEIKIYSEHHLLYNQDDEIFFSITTTTNNISSLMGDLFIEHSIACGNWVSFEWLYSGLPETLSSLRENQHAIPASLQKACFNVFEKYGVKYTINTIQENEKGYSVLFFSNTHTWPDEENFGQAHIVAKGFTERRIR